MNNKAEYNRCALPRLTTKLGEKDLEKWREEDRLEHLREATIEEKIRLRKKERQKKRGEANMYPCNKGRGQTTKARDSANNNTSEEKSQRRGEENTCKDTKEKKDKCRHKEVHQLQEMEGGGRAEDSQ